MVSKKIILTSTPALNDKFGELALSFKAGARTMSKMNDAFKRFGGTSIDKIWVDELLDIHGAEYAKILAGNSQNEEVMATKKYKDSDSMSSEAMRQLESIVAALNGHFQGLCEDDAKATLLGPGSLTVNSPKGFRKRNHIGGETFIYREARIGSLTVGARIIITLRPDFAADYSTIEMTEEEAVAQLDSFRMVAREAIGTDFVSEMKRIRTMDAVARDEAAVMTKVNDYEDFGIW